MLATTKYTITKRFDSDGVYLFSKAIRNTDKLPVFIKSTSSKNTKAVKLLEEEFEISHQIDVDWGIKAIKLENIDETISLIFEDYQGENLHNYINNKAIELKTFLKIAINITNCIAKMHEKGIVHKDIKPSNILINTSTYDSKLIDFSIASLLPLENILISPNLNFIEGSLPYMSPEQTGRMNRFIDFRSDLYSLGISFYEMITGKLPFVANDPLEWVYCHIAQTPVPPKEILPALPPIISDIIMKLLAKTAEERYQTASGLKYDLEKCLKSLTPEKTIQSFPLGEKDISGKFNVVQKLYGREKDVATLLNSFERIIESGKSELVLISGYSGIGKTSLVNELQKPILKVGGLFISGKLDQYKRGIPYYTIVEAFKELIKNILFQPQIKIDVWRQLLLSALGINGQIIIDIIPQAELIIGPQEPLTEVPPMEAKIRFDSVLEKFIRVFANPERPLTIFLDDLQWADAASLNLIKQLSTNPENKNMLFVGAYRDNEVNSAHPLAITLDEIKNQGITVNELTLHPLSNVNIQQLIADTLNCDLKSVASLASLVYKKTGGNPFFIIQFLKILYQEKLLHFNSTLLKWEWKIEEIDAKAYTDNVVDLMTGKIKQLPLATQDILKLAACIGNKFNINVLSQIDTITEQEAIALLKVPLQEGLLLNFNNSYEFAHDRIQQATYSLLSEKEKNLLHCKIGNLLLEITPEVGIDENIFVIVNHFSHCSDYKGGAKSKLNISKLYLRAGKKARASGAYQAAREYFRAGTILLPINNWESQHQLTFQLYLELSACEYLLGNFEIAEKLFDEILSKLQSPLEKAGVYNIRLELYHILGKFEEAASLGLSALKMLDLPFPETETDQAAYGELLQVQEQLKGVQIEELLNRPVMTDKVHIAAMEILMNLYAPFYNSRPHLLGLLTFRMTNYSLQFGNTASSPYAYIYYGILLGTGMGDYKQGQAFGNMALELNEKMGHKELSCKVLQTYGTLVHPWSNPMHTCIPYLNKSYLSGLETGDLIFSGFSVGVNTYIRIMNGHDLQSVYDEAEKYISFFKRSKDEMMFNAHRVFMQHCLNLMGKTNAPDSLSTSEYDEEQILAEMQEKQFVYSYYWYYLVKMQVLYHNGNYNEALTIANKIKDSIAMVHFAQLSVPEFCFYHALTLTALYPSASTKEKKEFLEQIKLQHEKLKKWAENSPENFSHKYLLIAAELGRILNENTSEVMVLYEDAIKSARLNNFIQNEALTYELASTFYKTKSFTTIEESYIKEARDLYLRWGAKRKANEIEFLYPKLREKRISSLNTSTGGLAVQQLDLHAIIKASQAISSQLVLGELTESLMHIVMEQAGAQKGALLLVQEDQLTIASEALLNNNEIKIKTFTPPKFFQRDFIPEKIVQYVRRTKEKLIIGYNDQQNTTGNSLQLTEKYPKSVACLPIIKQAKLIGILYLENDLFKGAFTADKIDVLEILAAQVAISIENIFYLEEHTKSEKRLKIMMKQMPGVIWTTDKSLRFTSSQGSMLPKLKIIPDQLLGTTIYDYFQSTDDEYLPIASHLKVLKGESVRYEMELQGYTLESFLEPLKNSSGEVIGCIGLAIDITERMNYIKTIEDKNAKLREIAWIQSHGVRAPLARIMSLVELLKNSSNSDVQIDTSEILGYINVSAIELDKLIHNIVEKTRLADK